MISEEPSHHMLMLPVRRRLMVVAAAYLSGVFLATRVSLPLAYTGVLCALLLGLAALRLARRKGVLLFAAALALLVGNGLASRMIVPHDVPTEPYAEISGAVSRIVKPYRVYLTDVTAGPGTAFSRDAVVTLMNEDDLPLPEPPPIGRRICGTGRLFAPDQARNPGGVNRRYAALADGYELSGYILPGWTAGGEAQVSPLSALREAFRRARKAILSHLESLFGEAAPLFQGVMLGEKQGMEEELTTAMRLTGTVHILTVSGMHLSLIALAAGWLIGKLPLSCGVRYALLSAILITFTGLTGCAAGTVRACIMALLRELALLRGRRYEPLTALSAAALGMTLVNPVWALDASFQFSFYIVLCLMLVSPGISRWLDRHIRFPRRLHRLSGILAVTAGAQLGALPLTMLFYGYVPLLSLPMNLIAALLIPVLLAGGWCCALLCALYMPLGRVLVRPLSAAADGFAALSEAAAALPGGVVRLPAPYGLSVLLFVLVIALLSPRICFGRKRRHAALVLAALLALSYAPRFCPAARYVQLDVGQGDAALFRKGRHAVLIDAGPGDSYDMLRYLRREGLMIDAVFLSHLDEDHAGALSVLLNSEIDVPRVVMAEGARHEALSADVREMLEKLDQSDAQIETVLRGDSVTAGGLTFEVLAPGVWEQGSNERSLLLSVRSQAVSFLLTGDLPVSSEPAFVPDCDVLKVAHHGSANATSDLFLSMAKPETALISVGSNWYGHPTQRTLDALSACGCEILRTDRCGCVTLWLHDGKWYPQTYLP